MDILNEMTKAELIAWIREYSFRKPTKSWVLFKRWQIKSQAVLDEQRAHTEAFANLNLKKRDEYAKRFNASSDTQERVRLIELMKPYHDRLAAKLKGWKEIDKKQEAVDRLYSQYEAEVAKEAH